METKQNKNLSTTQEHPTDINRIIESLNFEIATINSTIIQLSKVRTHDMYHDMYSYSNLVNSIDNLKYTKKNLEHIVKLLQNENVDKTILLK